MLKPGTGGWRRAARGGRAARASKAGTQAAGQGQRPGHPSLTAAAGRRRLGLEKVVVLGVDAVEALCKIPVVDFVEALVEVGVRDGLSKRAQGGGQRGRGEGRQEGVVCGVTAAAASLHKQANTATTPLTSVNGLHIATAALMGVRSPSSPAHGNQGRAGEPGQEDGGQPGCRPTFTPTCQPRPRRPATNSQALSCTHSPK